MKYIRQLMIILLVTCIGELLKVLLPLPIPASIYGVCLMLFCLLTGIIKLDQVKETGLFLVEIMPLMFIPAGVALIESWSAMYEALIPILVITAVSTILVMGVSGKVTDLFVGRSKGGEEND